MSTTGLFNRTGVRFEVALDVVGAVIAHYSEQIALERDKAQPDAKAIASAQLAKEQLYDVRDSLDPNNAQLIESVIQRYAPLARELYEAD